MPTYSINRKAGPESRGEAAGFKDGDKVEIVRGRLKGEEGVVSFITSSGVIMVDLGGGLEEPYQPNELKKKSLDKGNTYRASAVLPNDPQAVEDIKSSFQARLGLPLREGPGETVNFFTGSEADLNSFKRIMQENGARLKSLDTYDAEDKGPSGLVYEPGTRVEYNPPGASAMVGTVQEPSLFGTTYRIKLDSGAVVEDASAARLKPSMKAWDRGYTDGATGKRKSVEKAMSPDQLHMVLANAVTQYDIKQQGKRGYNPNALSIYLGAVNDTVDEVKAGKPLDQALSNNFNDRLLTAVQNAVRGKSLDSEDGYDAGYDRGAEDAAMAKAFARKSGCASE